MVLTDGTTTLTFSNSDENINPVLEKNTKRTAGGNTRSITGGERALFNVTVRLTPTQYRTLLNLLNNGADNYFFTPQDSTDTWMTSLYPDISFPLNVNITETARKWDNRSYWYVEMQAESTGYV